jgi:hypothetical protein
MRAVVALWAVGSVALLSAAAVALVACDTGAKGVEDCRHIERARCSAARYCDVGIETSDDVAACQRFVRDNCLHGFAVDDTSSSAELQACVDAIEAAGTCAQKGDGEHTGVDAIAQSCGGTLSTVGYTRTACEVVDRPELHPACQFLVAEPPKESPEPDAGGDGG